VISEALLSKISQVVLANSGLYFPTEKLQDLRRAIGKAASDLGFHSSLECAEWILEFPGVESRIDVLTKYLTVGETHFFRDGKLFQALEDKLIPEIAQRRSSSDRTIRIWSAGCASGEEPYSLAIVVSRLIELVGWKISILGTDINKESLRKAEEAVYTDWSFRSVPPEIKESYFGLQDDLAHLAPEIKKMVRFVHHNLAKDPYPLSWHENRPMDIIFCRNVIMYFTPERQEEIIDKLCDCLADDGLFVVSPAEASSITNPYLVPVDCPGVILFRKNLNSTKKVFFQPEVIFSASDVTTDALDTQWGDPLKIPVFEVIEPDADQTPTFVENQLIDQELTPYVEGLRLYEQGCYAEAAEQLRQELLHEDSRQSGTAISLLTRAYANLGNLEEALFWSEKAVAADKLNAEYYHLHATILQEMEKYDEAVVSLNRAVFLNPNLVAAHFALGNLFIRAGNMKQSDRHFKTALKVLRDYENDEAVPFTEGMSAGRLTEIILSMSR
jgi:chemotaxis protein methyltransferase CheR